MAEKWKVKESERLLDSDWVKVRKDAVDLPNGKSIDDFMSLQLKKPQLLLRLILRKILF